MSFIRLILCFIHTFFCFQAFAETGSAYNDTIKNPFIDEYCALSDRARATKIRYLENLVLMTPIKKKPFNYNLGPERDRKKAIEQSTKYLKDVYPEQEAAYRLGLIYSGIECEILQFKKALYYLSFAGRKPETHFLLGKIYFHRKKTSSNIKKSIDSFEKSGDLGIKQGYVNAISLLNNYDFPNKIIRKGDIEVKQSIIGK